MRFVELQPDSSRDAFELHPRITILQGLDPAARVNIVGFLHSIVGGDAFDWTGVVDVHGLVMPLGRALEIAGETAEAALIIEADRLRATSTETTSEQTDADRAYRDAARHREHVDESIAELAGELGGAGLLRSEMQVRLDSVNARLDTDAGRRLDLADGALGHAARLAERPDPWTGMDDVAGRIVHLEALLEELETQLEDLPSGDRAKLAAALATARASVSSGSVACPEAAALAAAWTSLHQRLIGLESRIEAAGGGTEAVAARLDEARAAARATEAAAVPRSISKDEYTELELLNDRVLELDRRTGRHIRRTAARKDYENARVVLNSALEKIGYPTWAALRVGDGMAHVTAEQLAAYEKSRDDLESAELEWAELTARLEQDDDLQSVLDAIDAAFDRAVELLDCDPYTESDTDEDDPAVVSDALVAHRVDASTVGVTPDDALAHLRSVLDESGAVGYQTIDTEAALVAVGDAWLGVLAVADEAAVRILRDQERADDELRELILLGDGSRVDRLAAERTATHRAEEAVAAHRSALIEVSLIMVELHMLGATELAVAEEHDAKLASLREARVRETEAKRRLDEMARSPDGLAAVISRIPRGRAGAIPFVVLMGGASVDVLDALLRLPDDVQVIVVGDTPGLSEWAANQENGAAKSIEVHAFV